MPRTVAPTILRLYRSVYIVAVALASLLVIGLAFAGPAGRVGALLLAGLLCAAVGVRIRELLNHRHLPGPRPSFLLGNLDALLSHEHGARDQALLELHRRYGPLVRLHLAWGSAPFVSLSKVADTLRRKDVDSNRHADGTVLPNSLMGLEAGDAHQRHRRALAASFSARAVRAGAGRMASVSALYLEAWRQDRTRHGSLKADLHHWSAHSLGAFLAGKDWATGDDLHEYLGAIATLEEAISTRAFHPFFVRWFLVRQRARTRAAHRALSTFFAGLLARRTGCPAGGDVLGRLAGLGEADGWSHDERVEEMISLVAGGTDAMSYTVAQALVLLSRHPDLQARARAHAVLALAAPAGAPPPSYLVHVLEETLRLFPPVPFSSKVVPAGGVVELGHQIPAGTNLMWMKTAVGLNGDVFQEPERFDPDRFASRRESILQALPFGAGPRHCIGRGLAEETCAAFLAAILCSFELVPIEVENVTFFATVSVTPSQVPVRLVPRPIEVSDEPAVAERCPFRAQA
jgi:cytochrome P450